MIEIQLSLIIQIILYSISLGIFYSTTKWIVTGLNDGYDFNIKRSDDLLLVLTWDTAAIIMIIAGLHFGGIIKIV